MMKKKPLKVLGFLGATTAATLMGATSASAIVIDNYFSEDAEDGTQTVDASETDDYDAAENDEIFGGTRTVDMTNALEDEDANDTTVIGDGEFEFVTGAADGERTVTVSYEDDDGQNFAEAGSGIGFNEISGSLETGEEDDGLEVTISGNADSTATATVNRFRGDADSLFLSFEDDFEDASDDLLEEVREVDISLTTPDGGEDPFIVGSTEVTDADPVPFNTQSWIGLALLGSWGTWKYWQRKRTQQN